MSDGYRGAMLVAAYLIFGAAWIPMDDYHALPNMQSVDYKVCHKTCVPWTGSGGKTGTKCTTECTIYPDPNSGPVKLQGGSIGPTKPMPPKTGVVNPALQGNVLQKGTLGGSTGPTVPPKPTQGNINR
jgi:hypothetical protein